MKKLLLLFIIGLSYFSSKSQIYGNEWINFSQQYFKFPIYKEGLYRIDSATLSKQFNLQTLNPKNLQLFLQGKELTLYIKGESDDKINAGDYIEFYADANMPAIDSLIYSNIKYLPNPYLPLFSDTIYAFITTNNSTNNKRFVLETDTATLQFPKPNYVYSKLIEANRISPYYNSVNDYYSGITDPIYNQAEGKGQLVELQSNINFATNFSNVNPYSTSSNFLPAIIHYVGAGANQLDNINNHRILSFYSDNNSNQVLLADTSFNNCATFNKTFTVDVRNLSASSNITFSAGTVANTYNNETTTFINYVWLYYPHNFNLANTTYFKFDCADATSATKNAFFFSNFNNSNSTETIVYDLTNNKRIPTKWNGNKVGMVIPNGSGNKQCVMAGDSSFIKIKNLSKAGVNGSFINYSANALSKPYLIVYHNLLKQSALAYANYRQSSAGGGYDVISEDVNLLYEQFAYGVNKHPMALKNFFHFCYDKLNVKPNYVLLIGKGIDYGHVANSSSNQILNLIPAIGFPPSDELYTTGFSNNTNFYNHDISIGRIATLTNTDVTNYLNKVIEHEQIDTAAWKKNIMHMVGGDEENLHRTIDNYMTEEAAILKDSLFGANVFTFKKNSTAPIYQYLTDSIFDLVNHGVSLINIFGHGSPLALDQNIDDLSKYNNQRRYPAMIANSCESGNVYIENYLSVSERFVLANKKGGIAYIASTSPSLDNYLHRFTKEFYRALGYTKYGQGIGDATKEALFQVAKTNDKLFEFLALDMGLHGDPALKFFPSNKPDYVLNNGNVNFSLKKYTDSIGVQIIILNTAKASSDSISVRVRRFFPNGDTLTLIKKIKGPLLRDTLSFYTAIDFKKGYGLNDFDVFVDYQNKIVELNENNNQTNGKISLFIPGGDIVPVYPYKYAVIPKTTKLILKASTSDPFSSANNFVFQIDTTDKFSNPFNSKTISSKGGVVEWEVDLPYKDSTVYFWRVSKDSTTASAFYNWKQSSFQTIGTKRGWAQSHFYQFKNDAFKYILYNLAQRQFGFNNTYHIFEGVTLNGHNNYDTPLISFYHNSVKMDDYTCPIAGWNFAVIDSISCDEDKVVGINYPLAGFSKDSACVCYDNQIRRVYMFGSLGGNGCSSPNWQRHAEKFLNSIPTGKYVLGYTTNYAIYNAAYSTYSNSFYQAFEKFGVKNIRTTKDTLHYLFFGRKGLAIGQAHETISTRLEQTIKQRDSIRSKFSSGFITSEIIGPSYKWNSLHWKVKSLDNTKAGDTTQIKIIGINEAGQTDTLAKFTQDSLNVLDLYNYVDSKIYRFIKLVAVLKDHKNATAPQMNYWQVLYDEAPECAINPNKGFASINDSLQQGDKVTFRFPIENIGVKNFKDSLQINYWIEDKNHNKTLLPNKYTKKEFVAGELIVDTLVLNTNQLKGQNEIWINVNPVNQRYYQYEQYQFNNIARYPFKVITDITNPLLDVTFDGIRILNGDIVSSKPNILIALKDENKFLALSDTSAFNISLMWPNQSTPQKLFFSKDLEFIPASLPANKASVLFNPNLTTDGKYTLMVKAKDRSKNNSGAKDFQIDFEVNNKPSITGVLNYPNPFSTATKFVFTITGSEIPEVFTIQIMTISGKIVREITRSELGSLHIGRNITDFAWDGRDTYGDKLGNGVYLYKVTTKLNGQNIDKSSSGADTYFVKEFGKMVIMR